METFCNESSKRLIFLTIYLISFLQREATAMRTM